jgi:Uma2 family endonuclease
MQTARIRTRRWTRREYDRLIDVGILHEDDKIELLRGRLIVAEPHSTGHASGIALAAERLRLVFGVGWLVRVQLPLALDPDSEPEPDVAVVAGGPRDFVNHHPATAALVVEVADSSLRLDRQIKVETYARARIPEYWIVNLVDRVVEVHRDPLVDERRRARYRSVHVARPGDTLTPLAAPAASIAVDDLLP